MFQVVDCRFYEKVHGTGKRKPAMEGMYARYVKRVLDFSLALISLLLLWWVLVIVAVLVRVKLGSPVIFKQPRPGRNEKVFMLYKFRSMTNERDANGDLMSDEMRLTAFGKSLRATSLDELPELLNILKGEMSLVGPRPQLVRDMVFMTDEQRQRHLVRPGLSGLAQVSGRNAISWDEKLRLDLDYVENVSFLSDCAIVVQTVVRVFAREGISTEGSETSSDLGDYLLQSGRVSGVEYNTKIEKAKELLP